MTRRHCLFLLVACAAAAGAGVAVAGPEECLSLRDNVAVAGCASRYSHATPTTATAAPSPRPAALTAHQPIQAAEQWLLFPVPTAASRKPVPASEPPEVILARDRSELIRRAGIGAVALAAIGLIFGIWRWRASMAKSCSFCGARVAPDAAVCKRCFRSA